MIIQAIDRIEQIDTIENVALSCHTPIPATYVIVDGNFNCKVISRERFAFNSKYVAMDFYSRIIDVNKVVDRKKLISSNNYLTFFYKIKNVKRLLDSSIIDTYYANLETPDEGLVYRDWVVQNISSFRSTTLNGLVKIFFLKDMDNYISLGRKYLKENILSNIVKINKKELGTSNFINLNQKKPYLKNKTRKQAIPQLISVEIALKYKFFTDILTTLVLKGYPFLYILENGQMIPVNLKGDIPDISFVNGILLSYKLNNVGKLVIQDMDIVNQYSPYL